MHRLTVLATCLWALVSGLSPAAADEAARRAPSRLYPEPPSFLLLRLGGDRAHFRYTPGALDRAANLQTRMELVARFFEKWSGEPFELAIFVLGRSEWEQAGFDVEYGIPVRVGTRAIAAPARGDPATVGLWSQLLDGVLPTVLGTPILGTPQEVASMMVADVLVQLEAGEIFVDSLGLTGDEPWVRPVMAHLAACAVVERAGTDRPQDVAAFYRQLLDRRPPKEYSLRDYGPDLALDDWLWFQAKFHFAARTIYDKEGKDAVKKMQGLAKKDKGSIRTDRLRRRYKGLDEWLETNFAIVSRKR